jgi:hypothetical protein
MRSLPWPDVVQNVMTFNCFCRTDDKYFFQVESSLRAFLLKISVCDAMLKPNPSGKVTCTLSYFEVLRTGLCHLFGEVAFKPKGTT